MKWRPNWGVEGDGAPANTETWAFPWTLMISEISTIDLDETGAGPWHHLKEKQNSELSVFNGKCNQYETSNAESCYIQYEIRYGTVSYELIIMIYYYYYTTRSIWYCMTVYEEPRGAGWACSISCQISFSASSGSPESAIKKLCHSIEWSLYGIEQPAILAKELFHHPLPPWGVKLVLAEEMKNATAASSGIAVTPSSNFNSSGSLHALQLPIKSSSCRRGLSGLLPPSSPIPMILCKELRLKIKQKTQEDCRIFGWPAATIFPGKTSAFLNCGTSQFSFLPLAPPRLPIHVGGFKLHPTQPVSDTSIYPMIFFGSPWQPAWPLHFCSRPAGIRSNTCLANRTIAA